ncbi:MAG TPA: RluA family pseudouridine synthase [Ktedonobacterales bacterium]|nr:RluA family pseudouridine synthase [Ktedonobacterales bacterium]
MGHTSRAPQPGTPPTTPATVDRADWGVVTITDALAGQRLDRALAELRPELSRTRAQTAIKAGEVTVNGKLAKPSLPLEANDHLALSPTLGHDAIRESINAPQAEAIPLRVIYEDAHLLVIDKPAGLVTHPAPGHATGTLVNALLAHTPELGDQDETDNPQRPGIVHRLDKDTSGLLVIAKDAQTHAALADQMREHAMVKRYLAMVEGRMDPPTGVIDAPIGRDPRNRLRMALVTVAHGGRDARTRFQTLRYLTGGRSLLEAQLETGRTHQIRVHLAALHHPVVGDPTYGRPQAPMPPRQFLHAAHLEFRHPATGQWMVFDTPLPEDLAAFLRRLDEQAAR